MGKKIGFNAGDSGPVDFGEYNLFLFCIGFFYIVFFISLNVYNFFFLFIDLVVENAPITNLMGSEA